MKLKHLVNATEHAALSEELKALYSATGENFALEVDGLVPVARVNEFRQNNVKLRAALETVAAQVTGRDAAEFRGAVTLEEITADVTSGLTQLRADVPAKKDEIEKTIQERTAAMRTEFAKTQARLQKEADAANSQLGLLKINSAAVAAASEVGAIRKGAQTDIEARALRVFKLVNGEVVAYEDDGTTVKYGKSGQPLTVKEWVAETLANEAPYLFEESTGAGSKGGKVDSSGKTPQVNPYLKKTENLTEQAKLERENPKLAERLEQEAKASGE